MPYIVPKQELTIDDLKRYRDSALSLLEDMIRAVGKNPQDFVFRDILPKTDLGLTNEEWKITYSAAYTEETKVNKTLPENKFIVFYGYTNLASNPLTLYIRFYSGSIPVEIIQVEHVYTYLEPTGYFKPIGFREGETLKIAFYGKAAGDDYPVLRGVVAELSGETFRPKKI